MRTNEVFDEVVGQSATKELLSLYIDAYKETERLPFLNYVSSKGSGKSFLVRKFREGLRRKDGSRPPILEINCATIKNSKQFFDVVYPVWINNSAFLFGDELHCLPHDLQSILLSVLDVKKDPVRTVEFDGVPYEFDFRKISFAGATTSSQLILGPLQDRLRTINLEEYNNSQLFEIFEKNLENKVEIMPCAREQIISTFRGNPRDVVVKADDLKTFSAAKQCNKITKQIWDSFANIMGILPNGLSFSEIQVLKTVGVKRQASLTDISSVTGLERSLIQRVLEPVLVRKNLLQINQKRELSADGWRYYHKYCKTA
jgi:Holliday junction resolvasome RuvABC ATP-dependent DNA helicase subunit